MEVTIGRLHQSRNFDIDMTVDGKRYAGTLWYPNDEREWDYHPDAAIPEVEEGMDWEVFEAICKVIDRPRDAQDALNQLRVALSGTKFVLEHPHASGNQELWPSEPP